jgi:hypothetical protein
VSHFYARAWLRSQPPDDLEWERRASWGLAARELRADGWIPNGIPPGFVEVWAAARALMVIHEEERFEPLVMMGYRGGLRFSPARGAFPAKWDGDPHALDYTSVDGRGAQEPRWRCRASADGRYWIPAWTVDVAEMYLPAGATRDNGPRLWHAEVNTAVRALADDASAYDLREERLAAARALLEPKISG